MSYYLKALEFYEKNELSVAQQILQKGLLKSQKPAKAYHLLGVILFQKGFFRNSIKQFQKACQLENCSEYFLNLSIALNEVGDYEEANLLYYKALRLKHSSEEQTWKKEIADKHCKTAQMYLERQNWKASLNEYIQVLKWNPNLLDAHIQVALLLWKLAHPKSAIKHLQYLLSEYPQLTPARLLLAEWFVARKQMSLAIKEWKSILQKEPENKAALEALLKIQKLSKHEEQVHA